MGTIRYRRPVALVAAVCLAAALTNVAFARVASAIEPPSIDVVVSQRVPTVHEPPVDAPVIDPFRAPENPFGPGNRGLEYGFTTGQVVRASADGVVTFAGAVAGNLFVTVAHDDSLRTTVGFVREISVTAGDSVVQGQPIATAGTTLHFSARVDGVYIDPATLFQRFEVRVRLVP